MEELFEVAELSMQTTQRVAKISEIEASKTVRFVPVAGPSEAVKEKLASDSSSNIHLEDGSSSRGAMSGMSC